MPTLPNKLYVRVVQGNVFLAPSKAGDVAVAEMLPRSTPGTRRLAKALADAFNARQKALGHD